MTTVSVPDSKRTLRDNKQVRDFLWVNGIIFNRWAVPAGTSALQGKASLNDADKAQVLAAYKGKLDVEAKERGYVQADMVVLNPSPPNLADMLAKFDKTHFHDDDEVRYIFDGEGVFGFEPKEGAPFQVTVVAGDYIIVPAKTNHWFTLTDSKSIKAIRLFKDTSGWTPHYVQV